MSSSRFVLIHLQANTVLESHGIHLDKGAHWLSGRVLDSRSRGRGFESHWLHCVESLSKTHLSLLSTGSTQEDPSRPNRKIVD